MSIKRTLTISNSKPRLTTKTTNHLHKLEIHQGLNQVSNWVLVTAEKTLIWIRIPFLKIKREIITSWIFSMDKPLLLPWLNIWISSEIKTYQRQEMSLGLLLISNLERLSFSLMEYLRVLLSKKVPNLEKEKSSHSFKFTNAWFPFINHTRTCK